MAELTKADYEVLAEFRWSLRHFLRFSEAAARAAGITPQQHQALLAIKGFPGRDHVSVGELAERLQVEHHSAVGLADRLARRGLITRIGDTQDRRRIFLKLTQAGEAILERLSTAHREQLKVMSPPLARLVSRLQPRKPGEK